MTMRVGSRRSPASPGSCTRRATHRELRSPYPRASPWPEGFRTAARGHPRLAESRKRRLRATVPKRRVAAIAGALAAVPATGGGEARASALGAIAKAQGAIGDSAGALATAQRVETRFDRNRLLGEIAFLALSAGKFGDALTASRAQPPGDALGGAPMVALAVRGTLLLGAGLAYAALGRGRPLPVFRAQALGETLGGAPVVALQVLFLAFPRGNTAGIGRSIP